MTQKEISTFKTPLVILIIQSQISFLNGWINDELAAENQRLVHRNHGHHKHHDVQSHVHAHAESRGDEQGQYDARRTSSTH